MKGHECPLHFLLILICAEKPSFMSNNDNHHRQKDSVSTVCRKSICIHFLQFENNLILPEKRKDMQKKENEKKRGPKCSYHKAGFTFLKIKRSTSDFARTPFHTPCPARYSVLHLLGVLSGGKHIVKCFAIAKREIICECIL